MDILMAIYSWVKAEWFGIISSVVIISIMSAFMIRAHSTHQCSKCGRASVPKRKKIKGYQVIKYCRYCGKISAVTMHLKKMSWKSV